MLERLVTQSRMASSAVKPDGGTLVDSVKMREGRRLHALIASFNVLVPLATATTLAPNILILNTFKLCLLTSSSPMYTMHSSPNLAHTVAVATPC